MTLGTYPNLVQISAEKQSNRLLYSISTLDVQHRGYSSQSLYTLPRYRLLQPHVDIAPPHGMFCRQLRQALGSRQLHAPFLRHSYV